MKKKLVPSIKLPRGFKAAGIRCGIKPSGKLDLAMIASDTPCSAAGVFTTNKVKGEPVRVSMRHVRNGVAQAIICNSGVSNVATGKQGERDAEAMCAAAAQALGIDTRDVLVASTGVIGRALPMDKILPGIAEVASKLGDKPADVTLASQAIMTTDTVPKRAARSFKIAGKPVTLSGMAKGAGMIAPNMATMLSFIATDAAIEPKLLKAALTEAVKHSFNRMTIDSDTSTSDSVMILANGRAGHRLITGHGAALHAFTQALTELCKDLCYQLICDGEGITRVIRARVKGAASEKDADRVGRAIVDSPLVKTAIHGGDPNWGRLAMAVGKSGAKVRQDKLSIAIAGMTVFDAGQPTKLGLNPTTKLEKAMQRDEVVIDVGLGLGHGIAEWLGGDLSRDYIAINADYTT